jgi:hypothetical protein
MSKVAAGSRHLQSKLLVAVVETLVHMGVSDQVIRTSMERTLKKSRDLRTNGTRVMQDGRYLPNGDVSADLLRIWHRDARYIDHEKAKPKPLHFSRGRATFRSIVHELNSKANARDIMAFMNAAGLVKRLPDGRYLPAADAATVTQTKSLVVEHIVRSVVRLLSTVRRNASIEPGSLPLIERYAYVSDLDGGQIGAFAEFTKTQGLAYLQAVDDWMEQRRAGRVRPLGKKQPGVVAGVQIVAYLGDGPGSSTGLASRGTRGLEGTDSRTAKAIRS